MWKCFTITRLLSSKDQNWLLWITFMWLRHFIPIKKQTMAEHLNCSNPFYEVGLSLQSPFLPARQKETCIVTSSMCCTGASKCFRLKAKHLKWERKGVLCPKFDCSLKGDCSEDCWLPNSRRHQKVLNSSWEKVVFCASEQRSRKGNWSHRVGNNNSAFCGSSTEIRLTSHTPTCFMHVSLYAAHK